MSIADDIVRDFGRTMGMPELAFNEHGVVRLNFERNGSLLIERTAAGALLQFARPGDRLGSEAWERALGLCHFEAADRLRPDAGLAARRLAGVLGAARREGAGRAGARAGF